MNIQYMAQRNNKITAKTYFINNAEDKFGLAKHQRCFLYKDMWKNSKQDILNTINPDLDAGPACEEYSRVLVTKALFIDFLTHWPLGNLN